MNPTQQQTFETRIRATNAKLAKLAADCRASRADYDRGVADGAILAAEAKGRGADLRDYQWTVKYSLDPGWYRSGVLHGIRVAIRVAARN